MGENEPIRFLLSIHLVLPGKFKVRERGVTNIVEINGAYRHERYGRIWLKSLHVMCNIKVYAMQDGRMDKQTDGQCLDGQTGAFHRTDSKDLGIYVLNG